MLDDSALEELRRFLGVVGKADLFEYFGLPRSCDSEQAAAAIKARRAWAQGQQSNPKFRQEAIWLIKNLKVCRDALVEHRDAYLSQVEGRTQADKAEVLQLMIQGAIAGGTLSAVAEEGLLDRGVALGLDEPTVQRLIDQQLARFGAQRDRPDGGLPDHYALLGVSLHATAVDIERAWSDRYAQARSIIDPQAAEQVYAQLDDALATLGDPARRAAYDQQWRSKHPLPVATSRPPPRLEPEPAEPREADPPRVERDDEPSVSRRLSLAGPPPPAGLDKSRTIALGDSSGTVRVPGGPRVLVEGEDLRAITLSRGPHVEEIVVNRVGSGQLHATVSCSPSGWATVSPTELDPDAPQQIIRVALDPAAMPTEAATVRVTINSGLAGTRVVQLQVSRPARRRSALFAALGLLGAAAAAVGYVVTREPPPVEGPQSGSLLVEVDPPFGEIYVGGELKTSEGRLLLQDGLTAPARLLVHVELDGFAHYDTEVEVGPGRAAEVRARLELTDPMGFRPDADMVEGAIDQGEARSRVRARGAAIEGCLQQHLPPSPGGRSVLGITAYVTPEGWIQGTDLTSEGAVPRALSRCVQRELRGVRLPIPQGGQYALFRDTFQISAPAAP